CLQGLVHLGGHEMARAVDVVALLDELVVVCEHVADISNQRQPGGGFRRSHTEAAAVESVIDHGAKLVWRDLRRQPAQRPLDVASLRQSSPPSITARHNAWLARSAPWESPQRQRRSSAAPRRSAAQG